MNTPSLKRFSLIALSVAILGATGAQAATLAETCGRITGMSALLKTECMALGSDPATYWDAGALSACYRFQDNIGNMAIYPCVVAIRNRMYTPDQVSYCDNIADLSASISCFRTLGAPASSGATVATVGEVSQVIDYSLGALESFQVQSAKDALSHLKQKLANAAAISCK
jgi:hypothetical protein